ncbi:hypothetical protein VTN77DRAFT_8311 [Rasamsonia byssochlamydoides]|uniref:uncharacterized protein n=1 Tax=Rasamsonia byssochlamydoides TaxID=89139 RepID=UPI0037432F54
MDTLRTAAREFLQKADRDSITNFSSNATSTPGVLDQLWRDISSHDSGGDSEIYENLLVAKSVLQAWGHQTLSDDDTEAVNALYAWLVKISLPSSEFAEALESAYTVYSEKKAPLTENLKQRGSRFSLSISCLRILNDILPILKAENAVDIITTLCSFTSEHDPWTTSSSREDASAALESCISSDDTVAFWLVLEDVLKSRIRPIFAKTKNPAITPGGRKNFHPTPVPRFESGYMDPESKPWKFGDVYATTVVDWALSQFLPSDCARLEAHFPLLVPPILSLIDDESLPFKTRGCNLLSKFLIPIRKCRSDLLRRTNLSSVFDDALTPCLLSLPTITPEVESLQILGAAYPALLEVLQTRYHMYPSDALGERAPSQEDKAAYISRVAGILRNSVISSFHHVSSTTPTAASSLASFPYPRLSTFLLNQMGIFMAELGIHSTKYLQEIIPPLYSTLTNPFGTAYPPLLLAAVAAARAAILNAHPRIWRFRGELLGAFCDCWLHVLDEEKNQVETRSRPRPAGSSSISSGSSQQEEELLPALAKLKKQLQGAVYLLKVSVDAVVQSSKPTTSQAAAGEAGEGEEEENWAGLEDEDINIQKECEDLVRADEQLRELLFAEIPDDDNDDEYF